MTEEDYVAYVDELLMSFGGSWKTPSGNDSDNLYFSCLQKPIKIPIPSKLSAHQRRLVVERLGQQYGFPFIRK